MHANRNKGAIKKVEKGMMKANRTRNLFAVFAIVLTTFMITTVFSLGINYMENMELMQVRTAGTSADVSLSLPTAEQEQQIKSLDYVKTIGTQYMVGSVAEKNDEVRELSIVLQYYDATEWENHYQDAISNINGSYPTQENEIMLSEDALAQLGIENPTLNMEIPLSYYDKNGQQERIFTLSGWFRSYTGVGKAFVSESYCQKAGYTMQEDGVLSLSLGKMPDDFFRIQKDITLEENQSFEGAVSMSSSNASLIIVISLLVLFIIGSGYLLIYNVLYISISKDTRFYGLIKTLGTTQAQIKTLVKRQALKFACIGIPIGILLATAVSFVAIPLALEQALKYGKSSMEAVIFFHPAIFLFSIAFSAVTVWIACNAPAKAAAKVSPVEALRYQNFAPKKQKNRNSTNGGKLHIMAFHNIFRDKKRAVLVFMSLFLGVVTILGVDGFLGSLNSENYVRKYTDYDFQYLDTQFTQYEQTKQEKAQFDKIFLEQVAQISDIESIAVQSCTWSKIDFDETLFEKFMHIRYEEGYYSSDGKTYDQMIESIRSYVQAGDYGCYVSTLDDEYIEQYNETHNSDIDIDAFRNGEIIILGMDTDQFAPNATLMGKTLSLTSGNPDGKSVDFLVGGTFTYDDITNELGYRKNIGAVPDVIFVSEAGMERLTQTPIIYNIGIDIKDFNHLKAVENQLLEINDTLRTDQWKFISAVEEEETFDQAFFTFALLGNGLAILLIVIGLINFVNVMLTGVIARKNEFAIMESIGTTKKQIREILMLEGGFYALICTIMLMTLGNAFLLLVANSVTHIADYAKFEYPVLLVICLIAAIFVICLSVPAIVYKATSNETVIERLHNFEN